MLKISYCVNNKKFSTHPDVSIKEITNGGCTKIVMSSKSPVSDINISYEIPYNFNEKHRIFVNGFQSWTDSREYEKWEKMKYVNRLSLPILKLIGTTGSGDYSFKKFKAKKGLFYGYSYSYVRCEQQYSLWGSLNERTGYTTFTFDTNKNTLVVSKDLQGLVVNGEYELLNFTNLTGTENEVFDAYFEMLNIAKPRVGRTTGYTSWYNYYENITQSDIESDLEAFVQSGKHFDIFQLDDGYQTAVGDWLTIKKDKFPNGMRYISDIIHQKDMKAGLWLAPFGAKIGSKIATEHPDWLIKNAKGKPIIAGRNWGGFYGLNIYNDEVREYIKKVFDVVLNEWNFDMVKLDFLYAAAMVPLCNKTRGQIMCEAMDFIRECVGDKLILGCGVPLFPSFGKVDYCRIGADVGLGWRRNLSSKLTHREDVSSENTLNCTVFRRQLNGRAFVNDPDVILLRNYNIHLNDTQKSIIADINRVYGGLIFLSDRISRYDDFGLKKLDTIMNNSNIEIVCSEYVKKDVLKIQYRENNVLNTMAINMANGKYEQI